MLLDAGVTLVYGVCSLSRLPRLARLTMADIVPDVDALDLRRPPRLGRCRNFELRVHRVPGAPPMPLMFFDGCRAALGGTAILYGNDLGELRRVKRVLQFTMLMAYDLALQTELLLDFGAHVRDPPSAVCLDTLSELGFRPSRVLPGLDGRMPPQIGCADVAASAGSAGAGQNRAS